MSGHNLSLSELAGILHAEHELLGASFEQVGEGLEIVAAYTAAESEVDAFISGAALADLTGLSSLLISGEPSESLANLAFAGRVLSVGEGAHEAVLSGDGSLLAAPLLARTGDHEYVAWDLTGRAETGLSWVRFLAGIEQDGRAPFAGIETPDISTRLLPLLLAGPAADPVLLDYLHGQSLPAPGQVASLTLDRIPCLVVGLPDLPHAWLLLVPPQSARILWRSFLSFPVVTPVGRRAVAAWLSREYDWYRVVQGAGRMALSRDRLRELGLVRAGDSFVGARGLDALG